MPYHITHTNTKRLLKFHQDYRVIYLGFVENFVCADILLFWLKILYSPSYKTKERNIRILQGPSIHFTPFFFPKSSMIFLISFPNISPQLKLNLQKSKLKLVKKGKKECNLLFGKLSFLFHNGVRGWMVDCLQFPHLPDLFGKNNKIK